MGVHKNMGSATERINKVIGYLQRMAEPKTVLIITENEAGEIIDTRIKDINEAILILRNARHARESEEKTDEFGSLWWPPAG